MFFKKKKFEDPFASSSSNSELGAPLGSDLGSDPFSSSNNSNQFSSNSDFGNDMNSDPFSSNSSSSNSDFGMRDGVTTEPKNLQQLHNTGQFAQAQSVSSSSFGSSHDAQLLNSKLDGMKSELDALRQHILNIERQLEQMNSNSNSNRKRPMW